MKKSNALPNPNGTNINGFTAEKQKATNNINLYFLSSDTCRMGGGVIAMRYTSTKHQNIIGRNHRCPHPLSSFQMMLYHGA